MLANSLTVHALIHTELNPQIWKSVTVPLINSRNFEFRACNLS